MISVGMKIKPLKILNGPNKDKVMYFVRVGAKGGNKSIWEGLAETEYAAKCLAENAISRHGWILER